MQAYIERDNERKKASCIDLDRLRLAWVIFVAWLVGEMQPNRTHPYI